MIKVGHPYIEKTPQNKYRLCAKFQEENKGEYIAWYEVDEQYAPYLTTERSDAFVVALLPYVMRRNIDIHCEQVMSERLYYQLTQIFLPALGSQIPGFHNINIVAELSDTVLPTQGARGASVSGGVDSFYALLSHLNRKEEHFNLTHLAFFNVGASGDLGGPEARELYHARIEWVKQIADAVNLPLLCVDSNISEYLQLVHEASHTYRTLSVILALQKLFSSYFFASGYPFKQFQLTALKPAKLDLLNLQCLTTETTTFYLSGGEKTRQEKLAFISDYEVTHSYLSVCTAAANANCSYCPKCRRTMMGLYLHGKLDLYKSVFKTDWFASSMNSQIADACAYRKGSDWGELYTELKRRHKVWPHHYVYGAIRKLLRKRINTEGFLRKFYIKIRPIIKKL